MRHQFLVLIPCALAIACAKKETPAADSTTAMAAAPAALTDAQVAGTWAGSSKLAGTDSVLFHWTQVCGSGACTGTTTEMPKDTMHATYRLEGDSAIGVSTAMAMPPVGKVVDNWVVRPSGSTVTGHGWFVLADKPDSVVMRYTIDGARK